MVMVFAHHRNFLSIGVREIGNRGLQIEVAETNARIVIICRAGKLKVVQRRLDFGEGTDQGDRITVVAGAEVSPVVAPRIRRPWLPALATVVRPASAYNLTVTVTLSPKLSTSATVKPASVTCASSFTEYKLGLMIVGGSLKLDARSRMSLETRLLVASIGVPSALKGAGPPLALVVNAPEPL